MWALTWNARRAVGRLDWPQLASIVMRYAGLDGNYLGEKLLLYVYCIHIKTLYGENNPIHVNVLQVYTFTDAFMGSIFPK